MYYSMMTIVNSVQIGKLPSMLIVIICVLLVWPVRLADGARRLTGMEILNLTPQRSSASRIKQFACLPKDVRGDETVSHGFKGRPAVTVKDKLVEMKARCRKGRLVDSKDREIRFFHLSCWG